MDRVIKRPNKLSNDSRFDIFSREYDKELRFILGTCCLSTEVKMYFGRIFLVVFFILRDTFREKIGNTTRYFMFYMNVKTISTSSSS